MSLPIAVEAGDYSEIRKHLKKTSNPAPPDAIIRRGALAKLETDGTVDVFYATGDTRPSGNVLSGTSLYGVVVRTLPSVADPVSDQSIDYGGQSQTNSYVHVALCGRHREIIVPTIDNNGNLAPANAVATNIGKAVTLKYQNHSITVGTTKYWIYAGAIIDGNDGIIVGLAGKGRVVVRLKRSFFIEMQ